MAKKEEAKAGKTEETIAIKQFEKRAFVVTIAGDTPLVVNRESEKAARMIAEKQRGGKVENVKAARNPLQEFVDSLYWLEGKPGDVGEGDGEKVAEALAKGRFGLKCTAFKESAVSAAEFVKSIKYKKHGYRVFWVRGENVNGEEFCEILGGRPAMRTDFVTLAGPSRPKDLRYRGIFDQWKVNIRVEYLPALVTMEQIVNWFNFGGAMGGMGEYRNEKGGTWGSYHVETVKTCD
jgi:hypothetical protein